MCLCSILKTIVFRTLSSTCEKIGISLAGPLFVLLNLSMHHHNMVGIGRRYWTGAIRSGIPPISGGRVDRALYAGSWI
jgi:hypothetical protein